MITKYYFFILVYFVCGDNTLYSMHTGNNPQGQQNLSCCSMRIKDKNNNAPMADRLIYFHPFVPQITLDLSLYEVPPEDFCDKVAELCEKSKIPFPVVPLIDKCKGVDAICNRLVDQSQNILFSQEYVDNYKLNESIDLRLMLGHKLAHRSDPPTFRPALIYVKNVKKQFDNACLAAAIFPFACLVGKMVFGFQNGVLVFLCCTPYAGLIGFFILFPYISKSVQLCHKVELECDTKGVKMFAKTANEQIQLAKKGICQFFKYKKEIFSLSALVYWTHPSFDARMNNLQNFINNLQRQGLLFEKFSI